MVYFFYSVLVAFVKDYIDLFPVSYVLFLTKLLDASIFNLSLYFFQFIALISVSVHYFVFICDLIFPWRYKKFFKHFINLLCMLLPSWAVYILFSEFLFFSFKLIAINMIFGGIMVLFVEKFFNNTKINLITDIAIKHACILGAFQILSLLPGFSRLGISFVVGRLLKFSKSLSVDLAFLLSIFIVPVFFLCELIAVDIQVEITSMAALAICSSLIFLVSMIFIKPAIKFLKNNGMVFVAYYQIMVGILLFIYLYNFAN